MTGFNVKILQINNLCKFIFFIAYFFVIKGLQNHNLIYINIYKYLYKYINIYIKLHIHKTTSNM